MKFIKLSILIVFLIPNQIFGQDCKSINDFNSFRGIKFGYNFADSIKQYFKKETLYSNYSIDTSYKEYSIDQKVNDNLHYRFDKYLTFEYTQFSIFRIDCLNDGSVFQFCLLKAKNHENNFDYIEDSIEIYKNNKLPKSFIKLSDALTSLFGSMSKNTEEPGNGIINDNTITRIWDCEKTRIELSIYIVKQTKELSELKSGFTIFLYFTNKALEKIQKLNSLKN